MIFQESFNEIITSIFQWSFLIQNWGVKFRTCQLIGLDSYGSNYQWAECERFRWYEIFACHILVLCCWSVITRRLMNYSTSFYEGIKGSCWELKETPTYSACWEVKVVDLCFSKCKCFELALNLNSRRLEQVLLSNDFLFWHSDSFVEEVRCIYVNTCFLFSSMHSIVLLVLLLLYKCIRIRILYFHIGLIWITFLINIYRKGK